MEEQSAHVELQTDDEILLKSNNKLYKDALEKAENIATSDTNVLLMGESGVGKEIFSRLIHKKSHRVNKPFVAVNCPALTETLLETELFGHTKGAFTGAFREKKGKFELADGGTLFMDEITDMSLSAQSKLLRAIEYKEFERVGGESLIKVNVRVITATNANLKKLIGDGKFRQDLFYRINEVSISLPPLRDRKEDIPMLAEHFLQIFTKQFNKKMTKISDATLKILHNYHWPGNVRELRSVIRRSVALADPRKDALWIEDLGLNVTYLAPQGQEELEDMSLANVEKLHIERVLRQTGYNKKKASEMLKISRPTLDRKIEEYELEF
ncbi:MAG: sigma-54-dependent Fis family transcriptional regulator [Planctomycetes bacterium]|nr:sigma-54-dependent Fis family transcriptional regulator [Planctomycetota bacterium]